MLAAVPGADLTGGRLHSLGPPLRNCSEQALAALQQPLCHIATLRRFSHFQAELDGPQSPCMQDTMQIFVKTLTGKTITLVSTSVPPAPDLMQADSHLNGPSPAPHGGCRRWRAQTPLTMSRARFRTRRVSAAGSQAASNYGGMSRQSAWHRWQAEHVPHGQLQPVAAYAGVVRACTSAWHLMKLPCCPVRECQPLMLQASPLTSRG